jgi:hypothetical protein
LETVEAASTLCSPRSFAFAPSFSFILIGAERFDRLRLVRLPEKCKRLCGRTTRARSGREPGATAPPAPTIASGAKR